MRLKLPKFVHGYTDRHGERTRYYLRRNGEKLIPLPGLPWSPQFMTAYECALNGGELVAMDTTQYQARRPSRGSIALLVGNYLASADYAALAPVSQKARRQHLNKFREANGEKSVDSFTKLVATKMLSQLTPSVEKSAVGMLRALFEFGRKSGYCDHDPLEGHKRQRIKVTEGFYTWTEADIGQFRTVHPLGSMARLAMELMLNCGSRRADALKLGPQHIRVNEDGHREIYFRAQKNGAEVSLEVFPELEAAITAMGPTTSLKPFLATMTGRPFTPHTLGEYFRQWCDEADLPKCTMHGLRKALAVRLANSGATTFQVMAAIGDKSVAMALKYTEKRDRQKITRDAQRAMRKAGVR